MDQAGKTSNVLKIRRKDEIRVFPEIMNEFLRRNVEKPFCLMRMQSKKSHSQFKSLSHKNKVSNQTNQTS